MIDLTTLYALALGASKGPWMTHKWPHEVDVVRQLEWIPCGVDGHDDCAVAQTIGLDVCIVGLGHSGEFHTSKASRDAEYIAAANPKVILEMIDELLYLRRRVHELEAGGNDSEPSKDQAQHLRDIQSAKNARYDRLIDTLKGE